jgi:uncharacterized membrane protein
VVLLDILTNQYTFFLFQCKLLAFVFGLLPVKMSNYSDMEDLCLFKEVMANTKNARIDWNEVASSLSWTRKSKLSLRQRLQTLKRRHIYLYTQYIYIYIILIDMQVWIQSEQVSKTILSSSH